MCELDLNVRVGVQALGALGVQLSTAHPQGRMFGGVMGDKDRLVSIKKS